MNVHLLDMPPRAWALVLGAHFGCAMALVLMSHTEGILMFLAALGGITAGAVFGALVGGMMHLYAGRPAGRPRRSSVMELTVSRDDQHQ